MSTPGVTRGRRHARVVALGTGAAAVAGAAVWALQHRAVSRSSATVEEMAAEGLTLPDDLRPSLRRHRGRRPHPCRRTGPGPSVVLLHGIMSPAPCGSTSSVTSPTTTGSSSRISGGTDIPFPARPDSPRWRRPVLSPSSRRYPHGHGPAGLSGCAPHGDRRPRRAPGSRPRTRPRRGPLDGRHGRPPARPRPRGGRAPPAGGRDRPWSPRRRAPSPPFPAGGCGAPPALPSPARALSSPTASVPRPWGPRISAGGSPAWVSGPTPRPPRSVSWRGCTWGPRRRPWSTSSPPWPSSTSRNGPARSTSPC